MTGVRRWLFEGSGHSWRFFWIAVAGSTLAIAVIPVAGYAGFPVAAVLAWIRREAAAVRWILTLVAMILTLQVAAGLVVVDHGGSGGG